MIRIVCALSLLFGSFLHSAELPNSLLWKVTSPQGAVSHVFGTIHLQDSSVFRQRDTVLSLVRTCRTYASEMHLDSVMAMMQPSVLFLSGKTLYDLADSADVKRICAALQSRVPSMSPLCTRLKPGAIGMLLSFGAVEQTAPVAMDQFLWDLAKQHKPLLIGLETLDEQIAVIDQLTAQMLIDHLENIVHEDSLALILPRHYANEDLNALAAITDDTTEAYSGIVESLNDDRNVVMVQRMKQMLTTGDAFIAIGALHLTGEKSILLLLEKEGYRVEPVLGGKRSQWLFNEFGDD
ncbi:MAG: TraB/GumN family protein [Candidatus Kapabacteria bacterium]|nr:TraB/GumN family protein [Ignavibacteria bacterium]MBP6510153.1 TraB/GumN family protein [Candidatus Kapabacteria bacterium]MBP7093771.1 TraB/GumN family protein [Candidatus Kapabacteria bacterium]